MAGKKRSGLHHHRKAYSCCNLSNCTITQIENVNFVDQTFNFSPKGEYSMYDNRIYIYWDPIPNGTVYNISQINVSPQTFQILTPTTGVFYTNVIDYVSINVYAHVSGCPDVSGSVMPCFLEDALVTMADNTTKLIKDVNVGDIVLGAFGEHNTVLALHRPLLGNNTMTNINNDHHTSSHHPHISVDKQFYSVKPALVMSNTYGKYHIVLDENMEKYQRFLAGLKKGRVNQLELGIQLQTINGPSEVKSLDTYEMAPETQLYNLVLSGSHTYYVDGYAVTGWPNEKDFDYDKWELK
jgi:hypothetical protein